MTARAPRPSPPALPPRYAPIAALGKGGGGEVWSVRDRITGRTVALKALREGAHEREVMALVREAVALSGVEGLGVPRVLRFGRLPSTERPYMVRELVEGDSLSDRLTHEKDPLRCLDAVVQTADKLTSLHRASLLHGDIKPANIIVGADGRATLVDLGLAAAWREEGVRPEGLTPKYAAPELFDGAPLTVRAEIFALGATIAEVLAMHRSRIARDVLPALEEIAARATATDPDARYPSADELKSALERTIHAARGEAIAAEPARARPPATDVWPIVDLDGAASDLLDQIHGLRAGGGIVITGPASAGRSVLLRRIAWSLGVEGWPVVWVETATIAKARSNDDAAAADVHDVEGAIDLELQAHDGAREPVILIDDAGALDSGALAKLEKLRAEGARLVLVVGSEGLARPVAGPTFEVFAMRPLTADRAGELIRRTAPSLSDAIAAHLVARSGGWPGTLRSLLARLHGLPIVSPADVDRELGEDAGPKTGRDDVLRLLDRGHFDEAAEALAKFEDDRGPVMSIARARLSTGRGDAAKALAELSRVEVEVLSGDDDVLAATWLLHAARAFLRLGDYAESQKRAAQVEDRFGSSTFNTPQPGVTSTTSIALLRDPARLVATEAMTVRGLAESFASRHAEAKTTLERSVRLARAIGEPRILSLALSSLAIALQRDDHLAEAKGVYEEALIAAEEAGDAGTVATARINLAGIAKTQGDLAAAIEHLEAAVDMGRRSGRVVTVRQALLNLANLDLYVGRLARARMSMDALAEHRRDLPPHQLAQSLALEAEYASRSGDTAAGAVLCGQCADAYDAIGRPIDAAEARLERVLMAAAAPNADAIDLAREIDRATSALASTTAHRALLSLAKGRVFALRGDEAKARAAFDEAVQAATAADQKDAVFRALEARAQLEVEAGQPLRARRDREAALSLLEEIAARLPRDLREVYWNDPRRRTLRASANVEPSAPPATVHHRSPGEDRLARILEINRAIAGEYDLQRLLDKVTDHAIVLLRAERGFVILKSGTYTYDVHASAGSADASGDIAEPRREPPSAHTSHLSIHASRDQAGDDPHALFSRSIAERVIRAGEPVVTSSAREDSRMADYVSVHQLMLQSVACVPIRSRTGAVIGALYLETRLRPAASFAEEVPTLVALADQVAIAIESARLVSENERRARELARANEELVVAHAKLEELLGHRTAQLAATRRDLRSVRAVIRSHFGYEGLVGTSESMRRVYALIDRVKDTDVPVLIVGESGTGKEVVARAIHNAGPRSKKSFVGINCGAIPEHLLESELFGHMRGAFTGADRDRKGLFREATEGTILLDEIGEMPQKMQAGLLRVLQEKLVRPVGSAREEPVDTRVIAATHRDLARMVEQHSFREDLYYRLNVILVRVPPLRERLDDIPVLIDHFLGIFASRYGRERRSVSRAALKRLTAYYWPGNVRQLENVLLNAWVLSDRRELEIEDFELPDTSRRVSDMADVRPARSGNDAERQVVTSLDAHRATERERILAALAASNWNRVKAAKLVSMPRRTFYRRLKEYGIQ